MGSMLNAKLCVSLSLFLALSSTIACAQSTVSISSAFMTYPPVQDTGPQSASKSINTFGLKLLADVAARRPHENVFIFAVECVFRAHPHGDTSCPSNPNENSSRSGRPGSLSEDALHESASALLQELASRKGVELSIANGLWSDVRLPLSADFIEKCRKLYAADATTLDFSQANAADTINN